MGHRNPRGNKKLGTKFKFGQEKKNGREEGQMEGEVEWPLRGGRGWGEKRKRGKEREKRGRNEENWGRKVGTGPPIG